MNASITVYSYTACEQSLVSKSASRELAIKTLRELKNVL